MPAEMQIDRLKDEVERLTKVNAELVGALQNIVDLDDGDESFFWDIQEEMEAARAALARAKP